MRVIDHNLKKDGFIDWESAVADAVDQLFAYSDGALSVFEVSNEVLYSFLDDKPMSLVISTNHLNNLKNTLDLYIDSKIYLRQDIDEKTISLHKRFIFLLATFSIALAKDIHMNDGDFDYFKKDLVSTLIKKQKDYGPENIAKFGITGLAIRMYDKIGRLTNLTNNGNKPSVENESLADTVLDLIGYCSLCVMWLDKTFLLPITR